MKQAIKEFNGKNMGDQPMRIKKAVSRSHLQKKARKIRKKKIVKKQAAKAL